MQQGNGRYNVGGVLLARPFKIRRLGHFGFNLSQLEEGVRFYTQLVGFRVTDELDLSKLPGLPPAFARLQDPRVVFTSHGSDHHALLLAHKSLGSMFGDDAGSPDITVNQITWQLGTLEEVINAHQFFKERGIEIRRVGRDMPGSNWHVYIRDPDGHTIELYYGIEQIGWTRHSKPLAMYYRRFEEAPSLPQMSEAMEIEDALQKGIDITSGHRPTEDLPNTYNVGGILLPRPFKVTRIGPVGLFVKDVGESEAFYTELLGFVKTEDVSFKGRRCVFLRAGTEHHSIGLFPKELRQELELSAHTTCMTFGVEVGSYEQLRNAVRFFQENGAKLVERIPPELYPGIDYATHVVDPDGHCLQLYYYMEQVGWDGKPRPRELRRPVQAAWPEVLEPLSDTYVDQTFQGPLG
jgi:catechol 2,3-dioxygenase-like lactoylglutathione lyase family enzyme